MPVSQDDQGAARRAAAAHREMVGRCMAELAEKVDANDRAWGLVSATRWGMDLEAGLLTFDLPDGRAARARMQVVGTHSAFEGRFLWGWANGSVPEALRAHSLLARSYGVGRGLAGFAEPSFAGDEDAAWEAAAVVLHLSGAAGAYRAPIGHTTLFLTFGEAVVGRAS